MKKPSSQEIALRTRPWGGKSMENPWTNPWTNPGFLETQISAKSQGLKTSWSVVFEVFKVCGEKFQSCGINFFDAVPDKIVPELISWRSAENIDFFRLRPKIEKITNTLGGGGIRAPCPFLC